MRVVSNKTLVDFCRSQSDATTPLQVWRKLVEESTFANFAEIKATFNTVDKVADYYVFDVSGNKYRLVAAIHFNRQMLFIRHVFTHKEYDKWKP